MPDDFRAEYVPHRASCLDDHVKILFVSTRDVFLHHRISVPLADAMELVPQLVETFDDPHAFRATRHAGLDDPWRADLFCDSRKVRVGFWQVHLRAWETDCLCECHSPLLVERYAQSIEIGHRHPDPDAGKTRFVF